jgi:UDPglucose--hexose-1-phosphate uridylyltransferase
MRIERRDVTHPDGRQFMLYGDIADSTLDALASQPADSGHDASHLHRRFDRLTGAWVLISPTRNVRPSATTSGAGAPVCPLCPGGTELPGPFDVAVFENRFPSLSPSSPDADGDLVAPSRGRCLVVVYTPEHVEHLVDLSRQQFANVVSVWRDRTAALWSEGYDYVMAFENHGNDVGATLAHLHGQIFALDHLPPVIGTKLACHVRHRADHDDCLGCRLVADDLASERVIHENGHFVAAVPFAPRWPLEVHVRAKQHGTGRLSDLTDDAALDLVRALSDVVTRYDHLWGFELPYLMCVQESPPGRFDGADDWHLHVELLPPHRNAHRLKVRASVETALGVFINDTVPESFAGSLRSVDAPSHDWSDVRVPDVHDVTPSRAVSAPPP